MMPLTFKEALRNDVQGVFLNLEEFADRHTIKYDGKVYTDIPASIQEAEQAERTQLKDDHTQGPACPRPPAERHHPGPVRARLCGPDGQRPCRYL